MKTLRGHHIGLLVDGSNDNYNELEEVMRSQQLGGPSEIVRCYDDPTIFRITGFFRGLIRNLDETIYAGVSGSIDDVCKICCNYNPQNRECTHPPYPGGDEVKNDNDSLNRFSLVVGEEFSVGKFISKFLTASAL